LQAEQYDVDEIATLVDEQRAIFNPDQATAFNAILESVTNNQGYLFFIHAVSGCGKTFLCNTIAAEVRRRSQIVLCVASSGIVALLLDGRRTSYSCFKIPLSIHEDSVAGLKHNSYMLTKFILFPFVITPPVTVVPWTSSHILYGLPLHQKGDISKATC